MDPKNVPAWTEYWTALPLEHSTEKPEGEPSIYMKATSILINYIPMVWLVAGLMGNMLSLMTLTRPGMRHQTTSLYLSGLAISDTASLVFSFMDFAGPGEPYCHINGMLMVGSVTCSGQMVLLVTVERLIVVWFPLKASVWLRRQRAWIFVIAGFVVSYGMFIPRVLFRSEENYCDPGPPYNKAFFVQLMVFYSVVPICVLVVFNTAIVVKLNLSNTMLQESSNMGAKATEIRKATSLIISVSVAYIILTLPSTVTVLYVKVTNSPLFNDPDKEMLLGISCYNFIMINNCINFWLYVLISSNFRKTLRKIFTCAGDTGSTTPKPGISLKGATTMSNVESCVSTTKE